METSEYVFDAKHLHDVQQLGGVMNVIRILLIADRGEVAQQLPALQEFNASTLRMLSGKIKQAADKNQLTESEKKKDTSKALLKLLKVGIYIDHHIENQFDLAFDEAKVGREFEAFFKK